MRRVLRRFSGWIVVHPVLWGVGSGVVLVLLGFALDLPPIVVIVVGAVIGVLNILHARRLGYCPLPAELPSPGPAEAEPRRAAEMVTRDQGSVVDAVSIRPLSPADIDVVVELSVRAWETVFDSFRVLLGPRLFERFYPDWRADQANAVRDAVGANITTVALIDAVVVGFVNVILKPEEDSGEIYMIAVDPEQQRRGIASVLTRWALEEMRRHGMTLATVGTGADPGHAPARRTYEAAGFTPWPHVTYVKLLDRPAHLRRRPRARPDGPPADRSLLDGRLRAAR